MAKSAPATHHLPEPHHHAYDLVHELFDADLRQLEELDRVRRKIMEQAQEKYCEGLGRILRAAGHTVPDGCRVMGAKDRDCKSITLQLPDTPDTPKAPSKVKAKVKRRKGRPKKKVRKKAPKNRLAAPEKKAGNHKEES